MVVAGVSGGCSGGWQIQFGNEYCADTEEKTHSDARSTCHNRDSELASITSDAECDYVASLMSVHFPQWLCNMVAQKVYRY